MQRRHDNGTTTNDKKNDRNNDNHNDNDNDNANDNNDSPTACQCTTTTPPPPGVGPHGVHGPACGPVGAPSDLGVPPQPTQVGRTPLGGAQVELGVLGGGGGAWWGWRVRVEVEVEGEDGGGVEQV